MIKILIIVAAVLAVLVVAILGYASTKPDTFRVLRSKSIKARPERIFALIQDFREWRQWSPWEKIDPALKRTYSGPESGPGASYAWEGNGQVGHGRMEIARTTPPNAVTIDLYFIKPFKAHNVAQFTLEPSGDSTNVVWTMDGQSGLCSKVMCLFMDMDKMLGKNFEDGLDNMRAVAER